MFSITGALRIDARVTVLSLSLCCLLVDGVKLLKSYLHVVETGGGLVSNVRKLYLSDSCPQMTTCRSL